MLRHLFFLISMMMVPAAAIAEVARQLSDDVATPVSSLPPSKTEEQQPLSLADLESIAFRSNPTLAAASARINAARGRQVQAGLYPNPTVGYHAMQIGNLDTAGQQGAFISQRLITGGKLQLDREIAGKEIDEAHANFHGHERRVLSDVRLRFYEAKVAQRRVQLTDELAQIGNELVAATERLVEGRQATENDLLQAEIKSDESGILASDASNEHVEAWRRLVAVVGVPNMQMVPLAGQIDADLPVYDWDCCYAMVFGNHPDLNAARSRVARARIIVSRTQMEPIPDVDISVSVRHDNITTDDVVNVQAGIPIPVFNRNQGNIRSARAEWVAACNDKKRIELMLHDRLATVYRRFANARQQVERYKTRMVPRARRSLNLVSAGYEQGQVEFLNVLTAQQTYLRVSLSYLNSLRELRAAASIIDGQLMTDSLNWRK